MNSQSCVLYLVWLFLFLLPLSADTIILTDGKTREGQVLKISDEAVIIEVFIDQTYTLSTLSIPREQVIRILDDSQIKLYEDNRILVSDLSDFYRKNTRYRNKNISASDTLIAEDGQVLIGGINSINSDYTTFYLDTNQSKLYTILTREIVSINGRHVDAIMEELKENELPPGEKVFKYPLVGIEIGAVGIFNDLNRYQEIYTDISDKLEISGQRSPHQIHNPIFAVDLGFLVKINRHISLTANSLFTIGFGDREDYSEETEHYRLFFGEIHYLYPINTLNPWIGLGYAFQSITIINRYDQVDVKYKSQAGSISFAAGLDLNINEGLNFVFGVRYLPFGEKGINIEASGEIMDEYRIDLSHLMISTAFVINL